MLDRAISSNMGIRFLTTTLALLSLSAASLFAREESILARITVYWPGEGQIRACSNGAHLRTGHVAVDPKRIPYGSHVIFSDAECVAVDSGPGVVNRTAARASGRSAAQKNAIVIDRFFESKQAAMAWSNAHPQFMTVRVQSPESARRIAETVTPDGTARTRSVEKGAATAARKSAAKQGTRDLTLPEFDSEKVELHLPLDSVLCSVHRT
jgi:3D (Asp-Asp-Asp) domain-containing protein